jgi:hypothetical protein
MCQLAETRGGAENGTEMSMGTDREKTFERSEQSAAGAPGGPPEAWRKGLAGRFNSFDA